MSALAAVLVGLGIGVAVVTPVLWRYRREIRRTWSEALGITPKKSIPPEGLTRPPGAADLGSLLLTAAVMTVVCTALIASVVVTLANPDPAVRAVTGSLSIVLAAGAALWLRARVS